MTISYQSTVQLSLAFCLRPPLQVIKRPRTRPVAPSCLASPSKITSQCAAYICAAATAALLLIPNPVSAKSVLSTNTILRRYVAIDSDAILRYALPLPGERPGLSDPVPIRLVQENLERLGIDVRARGAAGLIAGRRDISKLRALLTNERVNLLLDVPAKYRKNAADYLSILDTVVDELEEELGLPPPAPLPSIFPSQVVTVQETIQDIMESRNAMSRRSNFDAAVVDGLRKRALNIVSDIEQLSVEGNGLPYRVPRRYNRLPRLEGRATVEMKLVKKGGSQWKDANNLPFANEVSLTAVLDGYSAPLTAGNFIDISRRGYYNNTSILSSQKNFFAQLGEREDDSENGFKDPDTGNRRQIPMEILVDGDPSPTYGATLDDLGIGDLQPTLPISAYGAMAMVHSVEDPNDASSQFYFFLLDPTSYQARSYGGSILTGSVSTFGYVHDGKKYLAQLEPGDKVKSITVVSGMENFKQYGDN